jgi:NAD(P)H-dependent flavin oxidoreductase YrpB (nitropropane dioxygenase family)
MLATPLCRRLRLRVPLVQAPIGSAASPRLVAAVSDAGGLGMLAATWLSEGAGSGTDCRGDRHRCHLGRSGDPQRSCGRSQHAPDRL